MIDQVHKEPNTRCEVLHVFLRVSQQGKFRVYVATADQLNSPFERVNDNTKRGYALIDIAGFSECHYHLLSATYPGQLIIEQQNAPSDHALPPWVDHHLIVSHPTAPSHS